MAKNHDDGAYPDEHPSQDATCRFPIDVLLRKHGFIIVNRPQKGETIWEREGKRYTQAQALRRVPKVEREDAKYLETIYRDIEDGGTT